MNSKEIWLPQSEKVSYGLAYLLEFGIIQFGDFTFSSGIKSPIKAEFDRLNQIELWAFGGELADLARKMQQQPDILVGVITHGATFARFMHTELDKPWAARMGSKRTEDKKVQEKGDISPGQKILIVEDVLTMGTNTIACIENLPKGVEVIGVISVFSYGFPQLDKRMKSIGIRHESLLKFKDLLPAFPIDQKEKLAQWHSYTSSLDIMNK